jgi:ribonuclease P protein component
MLGRKFRATRLNIEETIKTGLIINGKFLYAKFSRKEDKKPTFAIVISKKNEKTSVGRHLIKRKISSLLEQNIKQIGQNFKKTIVFLFKKDAGTLDWVEIEKDVDFILEKAGFFK